MVLRWLWAKALSSFFKKLFSGLNSLFPTLPYPQMRKQEKQNPLQSRVGKQNKFPIGHVWNFKNKKNTWVSIYTVISLSLYLEVGGMFHPMSSGIMTVYCVDQIS